MTHFTKSESAMSKSISWSFVNAITKPVAHFVRNSSIADVNQMENVLIHWSFAAIIFGAGMQAVLKAKVIKEKFLIF